MPITLLCRSADIQRLVPRDMVTHHHQERAAGKRESDIFCDRQFDVWPKPKAKYVSFDFTQTRDGCRIWHIHGLARNRVWIDDRSHPVEWSVIPGNRKQVHIYWRWKRI